MGRFAAACLILGLFVGGAGSTSLLAQGAETPRSLESSKPSFTLSGYVSRVVDGDTLIVKVARKSERVRLIGIDTPEVGSCYAAQATMRTKRLALRRHVRLLGDRTQARRDRYSRVLAYVQLPNGRDLGRDLIAGGFAKVYVYDRASARLRAYQVEEAVAHSQGVGLWRACSGGTTTRATTTAATTTSSTTTTRTTTTATTTSTTPPNCAASYPDHCIPPPPPDLNCRDIPYTNFRVLWNVPNPDPHGFDGDRDGIGCEK
jgi:micrococcal nuclease